MHIVLFFFSPGFLLSTVEYLHAVSHLHQILKEHIVDSGVHLLLFPPPTHMVIPGPEHHCPYNIENINTH